MHFKILSSVTSHGLVPATNATPRTYPVVVSVSNSANIFATYSTLDFDAVLTDPCVAATITLNSAIVPADTQDYGVGEPQDTLTFVPAGNISDDSSTTNPADLCA